LKALNQYFYNQHVLHIRPDNNTALNHRITLKSAIMNSISNHVQLIGNLGRDVEYRALNNGNSMARVSIATKEIFRDQEGGKRIETTWHQLIGWGKVAEMMQVFLKKGSSVVVQGKIQHQTTGEGELRKTRTEIVVNEFRLMQ
jgi:single-strand DNA-binding protein